METSLAEEATTRWIVTIDVSRKPSPRSIGPMSSCSLGRMSCHSAAARNWGRTGIRSSATSLGVGRLIRSSDISRVRRLGYGADRVFLFSAEAIGPIGLTQTSARRFPWTSLTQPRTSTLTLAPSASPLLSRWATRRVICPTCARPRRITRTSRYSRA